MDRLHGVGGSSWINSKHYLRLRANLFSLLGSNDRVMGTFASPTSASKRSKLHQRAHRRCFYLRQQRGGGVGLNQPLWFKQPCKVHLIKAESHKAGECSTVSNKTSSHPCFDSYTVGKRRNVSLYAQTSAVTSTWLRNSLGHRTTTGRTLPAHLVQRWQHITTKRRERPCCCNFLLAKRDYYCYSWGKCRALAVKI